MSLVGQRKVVSYTIDILMHIYAWQMPKAIFLLGQIANDPGQSC